MEIEIRAFIKDIEEFKDKLKLLGADYVSKVKIEDYWFCEKKSNSFEEVKQDKPGSYGLRIRKIKNNARERCELNCKVLEKEGDHNAFHEYETSIDNLDQTKIILEKIGFKIFCIIKKERTTYKIDNCLINIEDIEGFKPAVELEIISDSNQETHKEFEIKLLDKLGINEKDKIEKSITFLFMKEFSFKQKYAKN